MARTGIFCSAKEIDEVKKLHRDATTSPVILVGNVDISASAWERLTDYLEKIAAKYKAPVSSGVNTKTGEFVTQ